MSRIELKVDVQQWLNAVARLTDRARPAAARALNRSIATGRTTMTRLIAADMQLKAATVRERIVITEATAVRLSARMDASLKRIPLIDFGAKGKEPSRGKGRGVTAKTATRIYPHAFIATMRSGHRGVFQRRSGANRLPIAELKGASVGEVFGKYQAEGSSATEDVLIKNLRSEFRYALQRAAQKG